MRHRFEWDTVFSRFSIQDESGNGRSPRCQLGWKYSKKVSIEFVFGLLKDLYGKYHKVLRLNITTILWNREVFRLCETKILTKNCDTKIRLVQVFEPSGWATLPSVRFFNSADFFPYTTVARFFTVYSTKMKVDSNKVLTLFFWFVSLFFTAHIHIMEGKSCTQNGRMWSFFTWICQLIMFNLILVSSSDFENFLSSNYSKVSVECD